MMMHGKIFRTYIFIVIVYVHSFCGSAASAALDLIYIFGQHILLFYSQRTKHNKLIHLKVTIELCKFGQTKKCITQSIYLSRTFTLIFDRPCPFHSVRYLCMFHHGLPYHFSRVFWGRTPQSSPIDFKCLNSLHICTTLHFSLCILNWWSWWFVFVFISSYSESETETKKGSVNEKFPCSQEKFSLFSFYLYRRMCIEQAKHMCLFGAGSLFFTRERYQTMEQLLLPVEKYHFRSIQCECRERERARSNER